MKTKWSLLCITAFTVLNCIPASADPWFTGPLLAPSGVNTALGSFSLETYGYYTQNIGAYNRHMKLSSTTASYTTQISPTIYYGLADRVDTEFNLPYAINRSQKTAGRYIGDVSALLGFQLQEQKEARWRPNIRLTLQEVFPTGPYEQLNPANKGTDGTGLGSYQTELALNFQHLISFSENYSLCTILSLSYLNAQPVQITGLNSYGGNTKTRGKINPGNSMSIDLAGQLSLTKNWVAVMEGYYIIQQGTKFRGFTGADARGLAPAIGYPGYKELSLAPAIEYNFNETYGIIAGMWYSANGKNSPRFKSTIIAFNASW